MMIIRQVPLLILLGFSAARVCAAPDSTGVQAPMHKVFVPPSETKDYYQECVPRLRPEHADSLVAMDFTRFRYSYFASGESIPYGLETRFNDALRRGDSVHTETLADSILQYDPTDIRVHLIKAYLQHKRGVSHSFHMAMVNELEESILSTGDGHSYETAFHVLQIKEEYAILSAFGLEFSQQSLGNHANDFFDIMKCKDRDGSEVTVYFNITYHMKQFESTFGR